ncbi:hypothetical protein IQ238_23295 [Pleurocapsales cyanobacterium LEGE 06147]|nr:hypothetical protein [Pleurocapsales cyanobacterium LEGE 06147]
MQSFIVTITAARKSKVRKLLVVWQQHSFKTGTDRLKEDVIANSHQPKRDRIDICKCESCLEALIAEGADGSCQASKGDRQSALGSVSKDIKR